MTQGSGFIPQTSNQAAAVAQASASQAGTTGTVSNVTQSTAQPMTTASGGAPNPNAPPRRVGRAGARQRIISCIATYNSAYADSSGNRLLNLDFDPATDSVPRPEQMSFTGARLESQDGNIISVGGMGILSSSSVLLIAPPIAAPCFRVQANFRSTSNDLYSFNSSNLLDIQPPAAPATPSTSAAAAMPSTSQEFGLNESEANELENMLGHFAYQLQNPQSRAPVALPPEQLLAQISRLQSSVLNFPPPAATQQAPSAQAMAVPLLPTSSTHGAPIIERMESNQINTNGEIQASQLQGAEFTFYGRNLEHLTDVQLHLPIGVQTAVVAQASGQIKVRVTGISSVVLPTNHLTFNLLYSTIDPQGRIHARQQLLRLAIKVL